MATIFISFLGVGTLKSGNQPGYEEISYRIGELNIATRFGQRAAIEYHGPEFFDRIHVLMTPQSRDKHWGLLRKELLSIGVSPETIHEDDSITSNMNEEEQWSWFESLLRIIQDGDRVVFDFTHGFRSVPIIFSTAIGFLQQARNFTLLHAYYGYKDNSVGEFVDMGRFYRINAWADGVSRLVESADASKLAILATEESDGGFAALNDPELINALQDLTDIIKNINVNQVAAMADKALSIISQKQAQCSGADKQLLDMVQDKFGQLAAQTPASGFYDEAYFRVQISLAEILLKHHLLMQAFTVMRECVASIGMLGVAGKYAKKRMISSDGRDNRKRFGEVFVNMCQYERDKWHYLDPELNHISDYIHGTYLHLLPFYNQLEALGIAAILQEFVSPMVKLRNNFDHAWTAAGQIPQDIMEQGEKYLTLLRHIIDLLQKHGYISLTVVG